jgi:AraC-like DNA-binding protein
MTKLHFGFKQQFGVSIHEYQTEQRMQAPLMLLQTTDLPIAQIAERSGYGEPTNFTAAFRKHFDLLPREVRVIAKSPPGISRALLTDCADVVLDDIIGNPT